MLNEGVPRISHTEIEPKSETLQRAEALLWALEALPSMSPAISRDEEEVRASGFAQAVATIDALPEGKEKDALIARLSAIKKPEEA